MRAATLMKSMTSLAALVIFASPAAAQLPPLTQFAQTQSLSEAEAIAGCDQYAGHPLDPMKPANITGVANDGDIDPLSAYLYCFSAFQAEPENPRIRFQWGRANAARNPRSGAQPRQMYRLAYDGGSEIAGVYLARLPPAKTFAQMVDDFIEARRLAEGAARPRPMTGQERDQLLAASVITITSVALLRILSGEAGDMGAGSMQCSGTVTLDHFTKEWYCNGLNMGPF